MEEQQLVAVSDDPELRQREIERLVAEYSKPKLRELLLLQELKLAGALQLFCCLHFLGC